MKKKIKNSFMIIEVRSSYHKLKISNHSLSFFDNAHNSIQKLKFFSQIRLQGFFAVRIFLKIKNFKFVLSNLKKYMAVQTIVFLRVLFCLLARHAICCSSQRKLFIY
ncbi:hypothetical protein BpHYR1_043795 [Brachionus plicatilis]|uniref:Transmembrane protein n=1 Tax=Brachionus plicatilis TaxID=10195 RepID=A0A3M7QPV2_BRAPC|nr:hypothetical protein BpHYR1_043795 [Brachionus plicatilis]